MILSNWLDELREAGTVDEVVAFAASHFERIGKSGQLPPFVADCAVEDPEDVREIAAQLAHRPFMYNAPGYEKVLDQQLLILFSLATDRLAQLDGRGVARLPAAPPVILAR